MSDLYTETKHIKSGDLEETYDRFMEEIMRLTVINFVGGDTDKARELIDRLKDNPDLMETTSAGDGSYELFWVEGTLVAVVPSRAAFEGSILLNRLAKQAGLMVGKNDGGAFVNNPRVVVARIASPQELKKQAEAENADADQGTN